MKIAFTLPGDYRTSIMEGTGAEVEKFLEQLSKLKIADERYVDEYKRHVYVLLNEQPQMGAVRLLAGQNEPPVITEEMYAALKSQEG
jgi:hypothetical protein